MKADGNGAKRKGFLATAACGYVIHYSMAIKLCNQYFLTIHTLDQNCTCTWICMKGQKVNIKTSKLLQALTSNTNGLLFYQDFIVRHGVCSQPTAIKRDTIRGCSGVHCVYLPCEQPIMDSTEPSYGTISTTKSQFLQLISRSPFELQQQSVTFNDGCLAVLTSDSTVLSFQ